MSIPPFDLANYDACVFDLDGTLWLGADDPIPGAAEFLRRCRDRGIRIAYATNAIVHSPEAVAERLIAAGLAEPGEPVITSGSVMDKVLVESGVRQVAAVLPPALTEMIRALDIEVLDPRDVTPDDFGPVAPERALVVASWRDATIGALERLGRLAKAGHRIYLSSREAGFPVTGGIEPGGGVLWAALSTMYDVEATLVGKPSAEYAAAVLAAVAAPAERICMFGDSQRADVGIAAELGCDGVLLTGHSIVAIRGDLPAPRYVADRLAGDIVPFEEHV